MVFSAWVVSLALGAAPDIVALDNGAMRIEIDPREFVVRFVGKPGGENFLDPVIQGERTPADAEHTPSAGLTTQVLPFPDDDALTHGPAEVLRQGPLHAVLMGPVSPENGLRVRKEFRLADTEARAVFTVTVLAEKPDPLEVTVRNEARVPIGSALSAATGDAPLQVIESPAPLELKMDALGPIDVPPADIPGRVMLGALTATLFHYRGQTRWAREVADVRLPVNAFPGGRNAVLVLDRPANDYTATLAGAPGKVTSAAPLVFRELWIIETGSAVTPAPRPGPGETSR